MNRENYPAKKLSVAFLWHMHQPSYKDTVTGKYLMPWTRLHAVKDYFPMAALLEGFDNVRMTFNLVPSLLEQIHDYAHNDATDVFLDLTMKEASSLSEYDRLDMLENFFRVNFKHFIEPNERYSELLLKKGLQNLPERALKKIARTFSDQDFLDLQVLFNMAWFHSISIDKDTNLQHLFKKQSGFTEDDKAYIILKQKDIISNIIPLYKKLQDEGKVEISATPFYHPIIPLLCDTSIARVSMPGAPLPKKRFMHPEDAAWHIEEAMKYHDGLFGMPPRGMWPSEGSVSDETLEIMASKGIKWVATDEDILFRSIALSDRKRRMHHHADRRIVYQPYKFKKGSKSLSVMFRDKNLSNLISFNYNAWDQLDAAEDLMAHFRNISAASREDAGKGIVVIAMDGENAWEYYENNGRDFFEAVYSRLDSDPDLESTTISGYLGEGPSGKTMGAIFPGSWINHNFRVWICEEQDNLSWDYLSAVRADLVKFTKELGQSHSGQGNLKKAWREFYISEGSDWNWWYGGKAHTGNDNPFDKVYRTHLANVYKFLNKKVPDFLKISIA